MIGDTLLAQGSITSDQLQRALGEQRMRGGLLGDVLIALNYISEESLGRALADEAGVRYVRADSVTPEPQAVAAVPEAIARRHLVAPLAITPAALRIAQANPFDVLAVDEVQRLTGRDIEVEGATRSDVLKLIARAYGDPLAAAPAPRTAPDAAPEPAPDTSPDVEDDDPAIASTLENALNDAVARGATDIHIEPEQTGVRLRCRIDGVLTGGDTLSTDSHRALVRRLKGLARLDVDQEGLPQEGRITHVVNGQTIDLRVTTFPTMYGQKIAIRVLPRERVVLGLSELGFSKKNEQTLRGLLARSSGIVLVTGPFGAGKTTTLYAALAHLSHLEKSIVTIEDVIETPLRGVRQTQIRPAEGLTFATAVASLARQDANVIMIGEIRDADTAQLSVRAALSGVLILSTMFTHDAAAAVSRLLDMGLEPYLLASGLSAVVSQRLVRMICPDCREPAEYAADTLKKAGLASDPGMTLFRGRGCARCAGTGYRGRTRAAEILVVDGEIEALIRERADARAIKGAAMAGGMKTLLDDALSKALFGVTTIEEVLRVAHE